MLESDTYRVYQPNGEMQPIWMPL